MTRGILAVAALALPLAGPAAASDPSSQGATGETALRLLAAQNLERFKVGHPPLVWDPNLAASAASYGPTLASLHRLVHSPRETRPGQRENLAMTQHGSLTPEQLVGIWSSEKRLLKPGLFPAVSATGRWEDIAHYTQMIWPTTTRVGCAIYQADWDYLICRYSPPGNIDGKPVFANSGQAIPQIAARGRR